MHFLKGSARFLFYFGILIFLGSKIDLRAESFKLESRLTIQDSKIERYADPQDYRQFFVKLIHPDGSFEWLEHMPLRLMSTMDRIRIRPKNAYEDEVLLENGRDPQVIGLAQRIFFETSYDCSAVSWFFLPTPLHEWVNLNLDHLECDAKSLPLTSNRSLKVWGKSKTNWVNCFYKDSEPPSVCEWKADLEHSPESLVQSSVFSFIEVFRKELQMQNINPNTRWLELYSWATQSDHSSYDARRRRLSYGGGRFIDGLDGFVVIHEYSHALIDDLNPSLMGYEAKIIHEALSDYFAAQTFDQSCYAPYDARERDLKCERDLQNNRRLPEDFSISNPHEAGLILSGALWDARSSIGASLVRSSLLEALIRIDKEPTLQGFWKKFMSSVLRQEGPNAGTSTSAKLLAIGKARGLL